MILELLLARIVEIVPVRPAVGALRKVGKSGGVGHIFFKKNINTDTAYFIWIARFGFGLLSDVTVLRPNIVISFESFGGCVLNSMYDSSTVANVLAEHARFLIIGM